MTAKEYAINYAKKAFSVIPIKKGEKKPAINWEEYQKRIASVEEVESWFSKWPDAKYGIVCGEISGISVVDVEAGGKIDDLPETFTVRTGGGGYHFYYNYHPQAKTAGRIRELTDIRSDGGQVVGPGSLHDSGKHYEVIKNISFADFPLSLFPKQDKQRNHTDIFNTIEQGNRNESAAKMIGLLLKLSNRHDWSSTTWQLFQTWNKTFCNPPLNNDELKIIFKSISKREENKTTVEEDDIPIVHITEAAENNGQLSKPTSIGYQVIDDAMMGGVREGDLAIITGKSGEGKTTFAQNISFNMSKEAVNCCWFSYEVTANNLLAKFRSMESNSRNVFLEDMPIFTPKRLPNGNLEWVRNKIEASIKQFGVKQVFIDHIDFLAPRNVSKTDQHRMILKQICLELKQLAMDLNITIFLIAHVKKVQGREVEMQDIAESSGIYQLADFVFSVQRICTRNNLLGIETKTNESIVRTLKNRLTGQDPYMKFVLNNNVIQPIWI